MSKRYIVIIVLWILFIATAAGLSAWLTAPPVHAQVSAYCDRTISVSIASGQTTTLMAGLSGATVYVCAYDLSADTIATTAQFRSNSTNLTGAMRFCDECMHAVGDGNGILIQAPTDGNLTLTTATGAITGWVRLGRH